MPHVAQLTRGKGATCCTRVPCASTTIIFKLDLAFTSFITVLSGRLNHDPFDTTRIESITKFQIHKLN